MSPMPASMFNRDSGLGNPDASAPARTDSMEEPLRDRVRFTSSCLGTLGASSTSSQRASTKGIVTCGWVMTYGLVLTYGLVMTYGLVLTYGLVMTHGLVSALLIEGFRPRIQSLGRSNTDGDYQIAVHRTQRIPVSGQEGLMSRVRKPMAYGRCTLWDRMPLSYWSTLTLLG